MLTINTSAQNLRQFNRERFAGSSKGLHYEFIGWRYEGGRKVRAYILSDRDGRTYDHETSIFFRCPYAD